MQTLPAIQPTKTLANSLSGNSLMIFQASIGEAKPPFEPGTDAFNLLPGADILFKMNPATARMLIAGQLLLICKLLGIQKEPDTTVLKTIANHCIAKYKDLHVFEIWTAFDLAFREVYDVPDLEKHFQSFDLLYLTRVMKPYIEYRKPVITRADRLLRAEEIIDERVKVIQSTRKKNNIAMKEMFILIAKEYKEKGHAKTFTMYPVHDICKLLLDIGFLKVSVAEFEAFQVEYETTEKPQKTLELQTGRTPQQMADLVRDQNFWPNRAKDYAFRKSLYKFIETIDVGSIEAMARLVWGRKGSYISESSTYELRRIKYEATR